MKNKIADIYDSSMHGIDKKHIPELRFPEFANTGEWEEKKVGEVCVNEDNKRRPVSRFDRISGQYPYYGANGIQDFVNDFIFNGERLLVGEDGSVLTKDNTPVMTWAIGKFWVNNHAHVLAQKKDIPLKYIYYSLSTKDISGLVTGVPPKLNQENLNNIRILLPSTFAEQQKIAECLSSIDEQILATQQKWDSLKEYKRGLMQKLFPANGKTTPDFRFPEFANAGEWEEKKLGEILIERKEWSVITKKLPQLSFTITEGVIRPEERKTNQRDFLMNDKDNKRFAITRLNDIIYNPANVIYGAIHKNNLCDGVVSPIYKVFWTKENANFLNYLVRRSSFISRMATHAEGTVTKLKTLKSDAFLDLLVPFPPSPAEQKKIADCLSALDEMIAAQAQKAEALKEHKRGLMQKLFPTNAKS